MNLSQPLSLLLACVLALFSLSVSAEPLTDKTIRSFINSLEAVQSIEGELEALDESITIDDEPGQMPDMSRMLSSSLANMKGTDVYSRLEDIVQQHGFSDAEQWSKAGDRIFQAWTAIEIGQQSGMMSEEMNRAMEQINNNPNMSDAQKEQMRNMMGGAMSAMKQANNAPDADQRAVRPFMDELRAATGSEQ